MIRQVNIEHNTFVSLLTDAVKNYHLLVETQGSKSEFEEIFCKSCIFNSNFALEAAANTFISMSDLNSHLFKKVEKFSTIEKFDFVLTLFIDKALPRGNKHVQEIKALIQIRNKLVHPKIYTEPLEVHSKKGSDKIAQFHSPVDNEITPKNLSMALSNFESLRYDLNLANLAINSTISFLNWYVLNVWEIDTSVLEEHIFPSFVNDSDERPMYSIGEIKFLMDYQNTFHIDFLNLESINDQINNIS